mmetsp:Transcript_29338/g.83458  ORF Transcript_29338/g.83458 Transcript_29338/m.83458 type:complete len:201 (+) Transcript_29338:491-1093(+)
MRPASCSVAAAKHSPSLGDIFTVSPEAPQHTTGIAESADLQDKLKEPPLICGQLTITTPRACMWAAPAHGGARSLPLLAPFGGACVVGLLVEVVAATVGARLGAKALPSPPSHGKQTASGSLAAAKEKRGGPRLAEALPSSMSTKKLHAFLKVKVIKVFRELLWILRSATANLEASSPRTGAKSTLSPSSTRGSNEVPEA